MRTQHPHLILGWRTGRGRNLDLRQPTQEGVRKGIWQWFPLEVLVMRLLAQQPLTVSTVGLQSHR